MFRIGDFARLTGVSAKRLRHYDRIGLFQPAYVDATTRYRYYTATQIPQLQRVVALRSLGLSLPTIGRIAAEGSAAMAEALRARRDELLAEQERLTRNLAALEIVIDSASGHDVVVRTRPAGRWAALRRTIRPGRLGEVFVEVETAVRDAGARARLPPVAIHHGFEAGGRHDVEVLVPINRSLPAVQSVEERTTRQARIAAMLVDGEYPPLSRAGQIAQDWATAAGYELGGPSWVVYLRFSAEPELGVPGEFLADDGRYVTEIQAELA